MAAAPLKITDEDLRNAVGAALLRRRPSAGWGSWYQEVGDKAVSRTGETVENWLYGRTSIDLIDFLRLAAYFGHEFADEVLEQAAGLNVANGPPAVLSAVQLDELADQIDTFRAALRRAKAQHESVSVLHGGKVSSRGIRSGEKPEDGAA